MPALALAGLLGCQAGNPPQGPVAPAAPAAPSPAVAAREEPAPRVPEAPPPPPAGRGEAADRPAAANPPAPPARTEAAAPPPAEPAVRGKRAPAEQNRFYDKTSPAYGLLQKANEALAGFPVDRIGQVRWVQAMREGTISPRASVTGEGSMEVLAQDVIMTNTRGMPFVRFPHAPHTELLACSNCHEAIFVSEKGANKITMDEIFLGKYCGVCHDKVAFSTYTCEHCHNVPNPDAG
jgi:c(7)-type cytochrome triheme protein